MYAFLDQIIQEKNIQSFEMNFLFSSNALTHNLKYYSEWK